MKNKLHKELGLFDVFAISTGAMISSGFFLLPGIAAAKAGPAVVVSYILSGLLILPGLLSMAELSSAMPRSGGTYFFISRSLGPMFGTIDGIGEWAAILLKSGIALIGLGAYLATILNLPPTLIAIIFGAIFLIINLLGSKESGWLQVVMVVGLLLLLVYFFIRGVPNIDSSNFKPFMPFGSNSLLSTAGLVFVSYIGLTKVASVSEEVKNPERNIPLGMILSLICVMAVYAIGVFIVIGVLPANELYNSLTPIADAANTFIGPLGVILITIAAILAFATTANAGIMSASRYLLAMGRDKIMTPKLAKLSKSKIPKNAVILISLIVIVIVLTIDTENIAKLASTFQILIFALVNIAVIVMRESGIKSYDPGFRSPLYPYVQVAGILVAVVLIPEMGVFPSIFALLLIATGVIWYNLRVRKRGVHSPPAVAKMAERFAERLLAHDAHALGLDKELRQILKEKGLRAADPFKRMVKKAEYLELGGKCDIEKIIQDASKLLAQKSNISQDLILGALLSRSLLGETPAEAGVALPHVLFDDVDEFHLVFARCIEGIQFPTSDEPIYAIFILVGSRKTPEQHLRFLAEIARRAEDPAFIERWNAAKGQEELKKLLLTDDTKS